MARVTTSPIAPKDNAKPLGGGVRARPTPPPPPPQRGGAKPPVRSGPAMPPPSRNPTVSTKPAVKPAGNRLTGAVVEQKPMPRTGKKMW